MEVIRVKGGRSIEGEVTVEGAKNSALKLMAATLMAPGVNTLTNVPNIADVHVMGKVLKYLGARIEVLGEHELKIDTSSVDRWETPYHLVAQMRASTAVLGPLLSRFGKAIVAMPGGCNIGARKIDMHILGLESLGVNFDVDHGDIHASIPHGLKGTQVMLDFASVGATENLMMASVHVTGTTVRENAAREPEIVDLANLLNEMGAKVSGAGSSRIEIEGVRELHPVEHRVVGDRIEAGTYLCAGAITGSRIKITHSCAAHLGAVLAKFEDMGFKFEISNGGDEITILPASKIKPVEIITSEYPGFPTDMQAQFMALACISSGVSTIDERLFENRFMHVSELSRMGADIRLNGHIATISGGKLNGADVMATDLRASSALVLAALAARGESKIHRIYHLDRGYERLEAKLGALGADIQRLEE